jgi:hypothetical protein
MKFGGGGPGVEVVEEVGCSLLIFLGTFSRVGASKIWIKRNCADVQILAAEKQTRKQLRTSK